MRGGPQVSEEHGADLAYDTPFLPKSAETPLMVMAGFFHLRRCRDKGGVADVAVFPANCAVLEATLAHQEEHPGQHDQFSFNTAIAGLGNAFNYSLLGVRGFETLGAVIDRCRCYRFEYSDLDQAVEAFAVLADER